MILHSSFPQDLVFWLMFKRVAPYAFYRSAVSLAQSPNPTWREQLYQLRIPRLYIWSDKNYLEEHAELLIKQGVQVAVIPKSGHPMMNHNPAAFVRAISEFVTQ
jgi:pimeloyl-ACP methyl ester carboxylesterase